MNTPAMNTSPVKSMSLFGFLSTKFMYDRKNMIVANAHGFMLSIKPGYEYRHEP
jgi:hypothetical protein